MPADPYDSPRRRFAIIATLLLVLIVALVVNAATMLYLHDAHTPVQSPQSEALYEREDIAHTLTLYGACDEGCRCSFGEVHMCGGAPEEKR